MDGANNGAAAAISVVEINIPSEMESWVKGEDQKMLAAAAKTAKSEEQKVIAMSTEKNTSAVAA